MDMKIDFVRWNAIERDAFGRLACMSTWRGQWGMRPHPYRFLVPIDDSNASIRAVHVARQMASQHPDAELHLLNVQVHAGVDCLDNILEREGLRETAAARALLDNLGAAYCLHLAAGVPAETIHRHAIGMDELVMGSHGSGPFQRLLIGSVALDVAEKSLLPVTLVKAHSRVGEFPGHWVDWLLPFDGSNSARRALNYLIGHFTHFTDKPHLLLLNVQPSAGARKGKSDLPLQQVGETVCADALALLKAKQVPHALRIEVGDTVENILATIATSDCGHIVMGSRGLGLLGVFTLGSVSQSVARRAAVPVTLVK